MFDICLPNGNEESLIRRAKELGISQLIFLYETKSIRELKAKKAKFPDIKIGICLKPLRPSIRFSPKLFLEADLIAVTSHDEAIIRGAVSNPQIDLVFAVPSASGKDHLHYRKSNFNEILTNLAKKNKVSYAISFSQLLENEGVARAKLLGREAQNVRLCRRKIPIIISSFAKYEWQMRNPKDLSALAQLLGLNAPQSKQAINEHILEILKRKDLRRSKKFIAPGITLVK